MNTTTNKPGKPQRGFLKWVIAGGIIAVAIGIASQLNFGDNLVYFYVPNEVSAKKAELQGKTIKVGAMVKAGSVNWNAQELKLDFVITDFEGHEYAVKHTGLKPDMFKENQGVVVEGRLQGDTLMSQTLMVKHSEEYKKPDATHPMSKELLKQSIFKQ